MTSERGDLEFVYRKIGEWDIPTIGFRGAERSTLCLPIIGYIANSVPTSDKGKKRLKDWKPLIASKVKAARVKAARGGNAWDSGQIYAITLGFSFYPGKHGGKSDSLDRVKLDVDNFVKPVVDALAAGLFCPNSADPHTIDRWNFDDSNFNTLLIHRLPDARTRQEEGIAICVSSKRW